MSQVDSSPELQLFVGIDWGSRAHEICALAPNGKIVRRLEIAHSADGFAVLVDWLLTSGSPETIAAAIEDPHHPLVALLLEHGFAVYAINPKQLDRFRDRHSVAGAKDDRRDAYVLADSLRNDLHLFTALAIPDANTLALREASRRYDTLQLDFSRQTNRLAALLRRSAPGLLELCPAANEPFFFALLELAFDQEDARRLRTSRVATLLKKYDKRKFSAPEVLAVLRAPRLPLAPGAFAAIAESVDSCLPLLCLTHRQLAAARNRLHVLCSEAGRTAETLASFPGVGDVVTATFLAEASHALATHDIKALRALAGTAPVTRRSGRTHTVEMRRACNARLRDACYHWANTAAVWDPVARRHYQELRARGHNHNRALRSVADRLLYRLFAALRTDSLYRPPSTPQAPLAA